MALMKCRNVKAQLEFIGLQTQSFLCVHIFLSGGVSRPIANLMAFPVLCLVAGAPAAWKLSVPPCDRVHLSAPVTPPMCRDSKTLKQRGLNQQRLCQQMPSWRGCYPAPNRTWPGQCAGSCQSLVRSCSLGHLIGERCRCREGWRARDDLVQKQMKVSFLSLLSSAPPVGNLRAALDVVNSFTIRASSEQNL